MIPEFDESRIEHLFMEVRGLAAAEQIRRLRAAVSNDPPEVRKCAERLLTALFGKEVGDLDNLTARLLRKMLGSASARILNEQGVPVRSPSASQPLLFDQPERDVEGSTDVESHVIQNPEVTAPVSDQPDDSCDAFLSELETDSIGVQAIAQVEPVVEEPAHSEPT